MKALDFQARSALIEDRRARGMPCVESRELLATATAGELRRRSVRRHLRQCEGCAQFREDVRDQRRLLALALHVVPSPGLKESTLAAAGVRRGGVAGDGALLAALGARGPVAAIGAAVGGALARVAATSLKLVKAAGRRRVVRPRSLAATMGASSRLWPSGFTQRFWRADPPYRI